jgi:hypothetical protein
LKWISVLVDASTWPKSGLGDTDIELAYDNETQSALNHVLRCPWFERLWVWQEINARPDTAIMLCGVDSITWTNLCKAVYCLEAKLLRGVDDGHGIDSYQMRIVDKLCRPMQPLRFLEFLELTGDAKCSDPRDKLYAVLALRHKDE